MKRTIVLSLGFVACILGSIATAMALPPGGQNDISKAEADALAKGIYLDRNDLPGAKEIPRSSGGSEEPETLPGLFECAKSTAATHRPLAENESTLFLGHLIVAALVRVMGNETIAAAQIDPLSAEHGRRCLENFVSTPPPAGPYPTESTLSAPTKLLGPGAVAVHTVTKLPSSATSRFHTIVFFRVGHAEVIFQTGGPEKFSAGTERRLLSLLHSRAKGRER